MEKLADYSVLANVMTLYSLPYFGVCSIVCLFRKKIIFYPNFNKITANSHWVPAK